MFNINIFNYIVYQHFIFNVMTKVTKINYGVFFNDSLNIHLQLFNID